MLLPDFTEETEKETVLYFRTNGKDPAALIKEAESVYACAARAGTAVKNGELCVALAIESE